MNKTSRIITLTTDYGLKDSYVGAMKGAILSINPLAVITDISHLIMAGDIAEGAFTMLAACAYYPNRTIHIGVVDPGVGSSRAPLLIETDKFVFIGPDNGLLVLAAKKAKIRRVIKLTNKRYFRDDISQTFHGRDIFGPAAAHLSIGVNPDELGVKLKGKPKEPDIAHHTIKHGVVKGLIMHIDTYGNLITNIPATVLKTRTVCVETLGCSISGIRSTYSSARGKEIIAIIGSSGLIEIAANMASAAGILNARRGDAVKIRPIK